MQSSRHHFQWLRDSWKILQTDYLETFPQRSTSQLEKDLMSHNVFIKECAEDRLKELKI